MKHVKKLLSFLLALVLVLGYVPASVFAGELEASVDEIVVSFELYDEKSDQVALLFGPQAVEIQEDDNGKKIAERLLGAENVGISDSGWMNSFTIGDIEYSAAALDMPYGSWLVYKNNANDAVGPTDYEPKDGDVYRFVLTSYDPVTYAMPVLANDMDALYWAMAKNGGDLASAYQLVQSEAPAQSAIDAMAVSLSKAGDKHYVIIDQRTIYVDTTTNPFTYTETLSVDKLTAEAGETVTVTVNTPEGLSLVEGYPKANGSSLTKVNGATYTFEMPDSHVSITAEFEAGDVTKLLTAEFFLDENGTIPVDMVPEFDKEVNEYKVDVLDQDLEDELYFRATFPEGTTAQWQYYMEYSGYGFYADGPEIVSGEIYGHSQANMLMPGMTNGFKHRVDVKTESGLLNQYFFTTTLYPTLDSITIDGEELEEFMYDETEYEIEVPAGTTEITINAVPYDEDTYYVYIDGSDEDAAGTDETVEVENGQVISIVVDDDEGTIFEYKLTVKVAEEVEAPKLSKLEFRNGSAATTSLFDLEPAFEPDTREYTLYVPDSVTFAWGFATLAEGSEGAISGTYTNTSGTSVTKNLTSGNATGVQFNNLVKASVFEGGSDIIIKIGDEAAYTVHVARKATLGTGAAGFSLKVNGENVALTPTFARATYEYDTNQAADAVFTVSAKPTVASATLKIAGNVVEPATATEVTPVWTDHSYDLVIEVIGEGAKSGVYVIHVHEIPSKLEIVEPPTKLVYQTGEEFDPAGIVVKATYANEDQVDVPLEELTFSPSGPLTYGDQVITVSYSGATAEQPISFDTPFEGTGTESDPFQIKTLEDMYKVDELVENGESFEGTYLRMMNDITLDSGFNGIGFGNNLGGTTGGYNANTCKGFSGDFDGGDNTLTVAAGGRAPFDLVRNGCVHDLNVYGEKIDDNGVVSTYIANGGTVELRNVTLKSGSKTLKSGMIGGYGSDAITIDECIVEEGVTVGYNKDQLWIGGIAGEFNGTITNSACDAEVYGVMFVGGIVADKGQSMRTFVVENCKFGGTLVASGEGFDLESYPNKAMVKNYVPGAYAGGIVGAGYGGTQWGMNTAWSTPGVTIKNCEFTGSVTGTTAVGGIFGGEGAQAQAWDNGPTYIQDNTSRGKVSGTGFVGGDIGYLLSLNRNDYISGNTYNSEYAAKGIGGVGGVDTTGHDAGFAEDGTFYFSTEETETNTATVIRDTIPGTELQNVVSVETLGSAGYKNQWKLNHHRTDDPLGANAYDLCRPLETETVELTVINNLNMFKGVKARYVSEPSGEQYLIFSLSGSSYHYLFKGTYEEAVENGDNRENWIEGYVNDEDKWEFKVPVDGEGVIPLVAISQTYLDKYDQGQNPLARAFYPRQVTLDLTENTATFDDYHKTTVLEVENNVRMFKVSGAELLTVGGPNSNGYSSTLLLTMGSDSFDGAFVGTAEEAAAASETIAIGEGRLFKIPVMWINTVGDPSSVESLIGTTFVMSFHSVNNDAWYERMFTIDELETTLTIDPVKKIEVNVTVSNAGDVVVANEPIEVVDSDHDNVISADDVLIAVHDAKFEGGAAAGYATELASWGDYAITKLWGVENGGGYGYYNNNASMYSLMGEVNEGDHFVAFIYGDLVGWTDTYSAFDKFEYEAEETLTVTLNKYVFDYETYTMVATPCAGADVKLYNEDLTAVSAGNYSVVDNGDGTYAITFYKTGDFKLIGSDEDVPLVPAVSDLTVTAAAEKTDVTVVVPSEDHAVEYSVSGKVVTVTSEVPCKVGYLGEDGVYHAIEAVAAEGEENTYTFTAEEGVNEVLLVIKGDVDLSGEFDFFDVITSKAMDLHPEDEYTAEQLFAADVDDDDEFGFFDVILTKAADLGKTPFSW